MTDGAGGDAQLSLIGLTAAQERRRRARVEANAPAAERPVATVALVGLLPHLDREFDYLVTAAQSDQAQPGCRVVVRMAGKDVDGFILARGAATEYQGELKPLRRVVSSLPVLTPAVLATCRQVAADHGGGLGDVLRLAVPPRHAGTEQQYTAAEGQDTAAKQDAALAGRSVQPADSTGRPAARTARRVDPGGWTSYLGGEAFLRRIGRGEAPRAVWTALPSGGRPEDSWPMLVARAAAQVAVAGRGVVVVAPDGRDVERVVGALATLPNGGRQVTRLTHDLGVASRYEAFLSGLTGRARIVVGTRQAAYAPVTDLGLLVCWDDLDPNLREPRAPYPETLRALAARAEVEDCAVLVGSASRSLAAQTLVESGWAREIVAPRDMLRDRSARVRVSGADELALERDPGARSRLPGMALAAARQALAAGWPVLVQVPRLGYLRSLACQDCRTPARCRECHGPVGQPGAGEIPTCTWCGRPAADFECPVCGSSRLRSVSVGTERTAEEIGRAFPDAPVVNSSGDRIRDSVPDRPALVVATPGGEPVAEGGYGAVLILDSWVTLARPALDTEEMALWRWLGAASLAVPASQGGQVVLVGSPESPAVQALLRYDPAGLARRQLTERAELLLPPVHVFAEVSGPPTAVHDLLARLELPAQASVLGPVPLDVERMRALVRAPSSSRGELAAALRAAMVRLSSGRGSLPRLQIGVVPDA